MWIHKIFWIFGQKIHIKKQSKKKKIKSNLYLASLLFLSFLTHERIRDLLHDIKSQALHCRHVDHWPLVTHFLLKHVFDSLSLPGQMFWISMGRLYSFRQGRRRVWKPTRLVIWKFMICASKGVNRKSEFWFPLFLNRKYRNKNTYYFKIRGQDTSKILHPSLPLVIKI